MDSSHDGPSKNQEVMAARNELSGTTYIESGKSLNWI